MVVQLESNLSHIKNLVFTPCGMAGIAYAGAIKCFEEAEALYHLENSVGVSSGSYAALVVALGYDSKTMEKILATKDFNDFSAMSGKDLRKLFFGELQSKFGMAESYKGIFGGEQLRRWAQQIIVQRTGSPELTFGGMKHYRDMAKQAHVEQSFGRQPFKGKEVQEAREFFRHQVEDALMHKQSYIQQYDLNEEFRYDFEHGASSVDEMVDKLIEISLNFKKFHTVAAEIKDIHETENFSERYKPYYMNELKTPNIRIAQAIRLSASYPIWFRNGALKRNAHAQERRFTDGGLVDQFPAHLFDVDGRHTPHTLILDTSYSDNKITDENSDKSVYQLRFEALVRRYFGEEMIQRIEKHFERVGLEAEANPDNGISTRIIRIDRGNVEPTNFGISKDVQKKLVNNGYEAVFRAIANFKEAKPHQWRNRRNPIYTSLAKRMEDIVPFDNGSALRQ